MNVRLIAYCLWVTVFFVSAAAVGTAAQLMKQERLVDVSVIAEKILPAVVEISVAIQAEDESEDNQEDSVLPDLKRPAPFKEFFDDFLRKNHQDGKRKKLQSGDGSGFIVDPSGLVVTNAHVVENAVVINVRLQDGRVFKGEILGQDSKIDIAVLRIKASESLPIVSFGDSSKVRPGQWVIAVGSPFGLGGSVSLGIISARHRDINSGPYDDYLQTDAAINKGNSGGPLFNLEGEVIGVNTAIVSPFGSSVGIGFSIPANRVQHAVNQLRDYGEVRQSWLGIKIQSLSRELAESLDFSEAEGVVVSEVTEDGPAANAGLVSGDIIVQLDNKPVIEPNDLLRLIADSEIGKRTSIEILRQGKSLIVSCELKQVPKDIEQAAQKNLHYAAQPQDPTYLDIFGMRIFMSNRASDQEYLPDKTLKSGLVIDSVARTGSAFKAGLRAGDVIVEIEGISLHRLSEISLVLDEARKARRAEIVFLVSRNTAAGEAQPILLRIQNNYLVE